MAMMGFTAAKRPGKTVLELGEQSSHEVLCLRAVLAYSRRGAHRGDSGCPVGRR